MRPPQSETPKPYVRFKNRPYVKTTVDSLENDLYVLNESLYGTPCFNGTVLFALDHSDPTLAGAIATADADRVDPNRLWFKKDNIENRFVVLGSTAVGKSIQLGEPLYSDSVMNPDEHAVFTIPLENDGQIEGALQFAIDKTEGKYLKANDFKGYVEAEKEVISHISKKLGSLSSLTPSLPRSLGLNRSVTPNAFAIRWDVNKSTDYIYNSEAEADFEEYIDVLKLSIAELLASNEMVNKFDSILNGQGDGQNIVIRFPQYLTEGANQEEFVKLIFETEIATFIEKLEERHAHISAGFRFQPTISVAGSAAFIRFDSLGDATGKPFWDLANKTKK